MHASRNSNLRQLVFGGVLAAGFFVGLGQAFGQVTPILVKAPVEKIFVPLGFDTNDNVEVFYHGHFPNSCYKVGPAKATVDDGAKTISVQASAYYYPGSFCAQMLVPFDGSIKMGIMPEGEYSVVVDGDSQVTEAALNIKIANTGSPDDFLYAPVDAISISKDPVTEADNTIKVEGEYPYMFIGCMLIKELKTTLTPGNVLVVQPIAELTDGPACLPQADNKRFSISKPLGFTPKKEEYLLHARSTSGTSINRVIDFRYLSSKK